MHITNVLCLSYSVNRCAVLRYRADRSSLRARRFVALTTVSFSSFFSPFLLALSALDVAVASFVPVAMLEGSLCTADERKAQFSAAHAYYGETDACLTVAGLDGWHCMFCVSSVLRRALIARVRLLESRISFLSGRDYRFASSAALARLPPRLLLLPGMATGV